ncbi:Seizure 6-like protein [Tupaia chinensis]|uniref:Seizure 6-like protein n=1 Tax=Tupaia chinensis TaxID=246437 RepID=L9KZD1_TUPCH|nr:Seizure 6-like protein [Tupaia chinensis]
MLNRMTKANRSGSDQRSPKSCVNSSVLLLACISAEESLACDNPGLPENGYQILYKRLYLPGESLTFMCYEGFELMGERSPKSCVNSSVLLLACISAEESLACDNPGLPENGYQILYKRLYLPGESLTFMCYEGFELMGEIHSYFSSALQKMSIAEAAAESSLEGGNMALAIFIPVLIISLLLGGAYIYITRCRYYSNLRLPLMYSHPYSQITVETEFDNPIYETGVKLAMSEKAPEHGNFAIDFHR